MRFLKSLLPVSLLNLIALFCITLTLPDTIPNHTNIKMEIDGYGSRWITVILGVVPVLVSLGIWIYWRLTKKNERALKNRRAEEILLPLVAALIIIISWTPVFMATVYEKLSEVLTMNLFYSGLVFVLGLFMLVISNFMGIIQYNRWLGIRTPWTLGDETVWKKTHRLGGHTGVLGGILMCIFSLLGFIYNSNALSIAGCFLGLTLVALVPILYSYVMYKKLKKEKI